jgi:hypothetical protein
VAGPVFLGLFVRLAKAVSVFEGYKKLLQYLKRWKKLL